MSSDLKPLIPDTLRQLLVVLAVVGMLFVNGLAVWLPLNGRTAEMIAADFDILLMPANYTFAIWGLIFIGVIAYATYQCMPRQKRNPVHRRISFWFIISCLSNVVWIVLWHYGWYEWSIAAMLLLLESLVAVYARLGIGRFKVRRNEILFVRLPFSIYTAWITVATILNITAWLDYIDWDRFGLEPEMWAIIMIVVATMIAGLVAVSKRDLVFALVIVWSFIGIAVEQRDHLPIVLTAVIMSSVLLLTVFAAPRGQSDLPAATV